MATKTVATKAKKKDTEKPVSKAPNTKSATQKKVVTPKPQASSGKTAYHVSKRDNDGREWKVFIQGSDKVIKLFQTQKEALDYAQSIAKNKNDGSYVMLHGLDGKIRKY